jgi:hypothetical protein
MWACLLSTNAEELLVWDGIVTRNLADNVAESWMASQSNTYDREIDEANYRRWLDIKACMKLCNFYREKDRKATDYDPTEKYRLVWNTMTHNMRQVITKMGLDHTIDETTWPSASYSDMHNRVQGKKCTKGGQHVLLLDAQRRYIYEWTPRHNLWPVEKPFTASGPAEVKRMVGTPLFYSECRIFCTQNRFFITSLGAEYSARMIDFLLKWRLKFYYYSANYSASN